MRGPFGVCCGLRHVSAGTVGSLLYRLGPAVIAGVCLRVGARQLGGQPLAEPGPGGVVTRVERLAGPVRERPAEHPGVAVALGTQVHQPAAKEGPSAATEANGRAPP